MADEEQKLGTALSIVETQQTIVGNALVAASGTAVLAGSFKGLPAAAAQGPFVAAAAAVRGSHFPS